MKIKRAGVGLAIAVLVLGGLPAVANAGHAYQTANVVDFAKGVPVAGAGTLIRTANSATARIYTTGLRKKTAYTVWWVIWNDPSQCAGACDEEDLFVAGNSVFYAGGFVTGTDGVANTVARVIAGDLADGIDVLIPGGLEPGNGMSAEIHLIIRSHGKIIKGMADVQIGTFFGACDINQCTDDQAIAFVP